MGVFIVFAVAEGGLVLATRTLRSKVSQRKLLMGWAKATTLFKIRFMDSNYLLGILKKHILPFES